MILTLRFTCPVYVVIDTDADEIERVVVGDDQLSLTPSGTFTESGEPATPSETLAALASYGRAAAQDTEWPSWEFGW